MKKVVINPGCITCGHCEFVAPEVFQVTDVARLQPNANIAKNKELIEQAIKFCPVQVIASLDEESR